MADDLFRLVYCSRSTLSASDAGSDVELSQILAVARANNARQGVTGALLHHGGCFAQVLEGPFAAVHETFERIQRNRRHYDIVVLKAERINERLFSAWDMALAESGNPAHANALLLPALANPSTEAGAAIVTGMSELVCREAAWAPS